jgi:hypothetical protein
MYPDTPSPDSLPPIQKFTNVVVGPSSDRMTPGVQWPDFGAQHHARLLRRGKPVCTRPTIPDGKLAVMAQPAIFISMYDNHFGHMVSETVPRLAQPLAELPPDWPLIFTCDQRFGPPHPSPMFRAVMEWLDIPLSRLQFCNTPTLFRELHVPAQAEHLDGPDPTPAQYLDLLDARIEAKLPKAAPEGVAFVSRAALDVEKGYHAGERYLVACLEELGVRIVYPEKLPLATQMKIYAQSRHLVFSEGSALHGRQLFGRRDQHIWVLRRRQRSHIAQAQIAPRCAQLSYVPCFAGALHVIGGDGQPIRFAMSTLYRVGPLLDHFEQMGLPLRRLWEQPLYERVRDTDILRWLARMYHPKLAHWLRPQNTPDYMLAQFADLGLEHLLPEARAIMAQPPAA